ncbi:MAG: CPBP family intramembrane metalloprotease [Candidatus Muirbacterium halophilum]|nr:CPBP family intramembrane metalloprotease [Candidatus Muirbacterium halophilum]MCK9476197.1 CPBP family intramembrane metalloprotease [Candidatus Muirbacterium halophilum]
MYKKFLISILLLIIYVGLFKYINMDISDILSELDFNIIFSDFFQNFSFRNLTLIKTIIYSFFLIIALFTISFKKIKNNPYLLVIILFLIFCILDLWIISSIHLYYSFINNGNEIIMKDISALSYYNPGNEFEFFYNSNKSILWKGSSNLYYVFISIIRLIFIIYYSFKIKNSNKQTKQSYIIYINIFFTFFLTGLLINIKKGTEFVSLEPMSKLLLFTFVLLIVSIYEEYIFRDFLIKKLKKQNIFTSIIISSLIFTIIHFNYFIYLDVLRTFVLGIALGMIYVKYNIKASIIAHFSYNIAVFIMNSALFFY